MLVAEINGSEAVQGHVGRVGAVSLHAGELLHRSLGAVALEFSLAPYPLGTFPSHCALSKFVAQLDFKLAAVEAALAVKLGDVKFPTFLANFVGGFISNKGW